MASEVKSDGKTLGGKQLEFAPKILNNPKYRWQRIIPQSGQNFINLAPSSQGECTFELPQKVFNLAQSVLSWTRVVADQGAGAFSWTFQNTVPELYQIQFYSRNSVMMVDLQNGNVYLKINVPRETKLDNFLSRDETEAVVYKSNLPAVLNPLPVSCLGSTTASTNYTEQQYLKVSPVGVGAVGSGSQEQKVDLLLGQFVDTVLGMDKNLLFGEITIIRCVFQSNKVGFLSTSNINPATGASALIAGNSSSATVANTTNFCVYLAGLSLYLACEDRKDVIEQMWAKLRSGYKMVVPYVYQQKDNLSGSSVTQSYKLGTEHGMFLRKAIHAIFATAESGITAFDHSNLPTAAYANPPIGSKITQFHTEIDAKRVQDQDMYAVMDPPVGQPHDYLEQKRQIKGSVVEGRRQFYQNWAFCDNYCYESPADGMAPSEAVGGLDLRSSQRKYDFVVTNAPSGGSYGALNHYTFFVTTKVMEVSSSGVNMDGKL